MMKRWAHGQEQVNLFYVYITVQKEQLQAQ